MTRPQALAIIVLPWLCCAHASAVVQEPVSGATPLPANALVAPESHEIFRKAYDAHAAGRHQEAVDLFEFGLESEPENFEALYHLAGAKLGLADVAGARSVYQRVADAGQGLVAMRAAEAVRSLDLLGDAHLEQSEQERYVAYPELAQLFRVFRPSSEKRYRIDVHLERYDLGGKKKLSKRDLDKCQLRYAGDYLSASNAEMLEYTLEAPLIAEATPDQLYNSTSNRCIAKSKPPGPATLTFWEPKQHLSRSRKYRYGELVNLEVWGEPFDMRDKNQFSVFIRMDIREEMKSPELSTSESLLTCELSTDNSPLYLEACTLLSRGFDSKLSKSQHTAKLLADRILLPGMVSVSSEAFRTDWRLKQESGVLNEVGSSWQYETEVDTRFPSHPFFDSISRYHVTVTRTH